MLTWDRIVDDIAPTTDRADTGVRAVDRSDLRIRPLLDDPALRRAMGLDPLDLVAASATVAGVHRTPTRNRSHQQATRARGPRAPRFDRRRLLEEAAA